MSKSTSRKIADLLGYEGSDRDTCFSKPRETRKYSLFESVNGQWVRISELALTKSVAVNVFQSRLLDGALGGRMYMLRTVK